MTQSLVLNGTSSAGKSSVAHELQKQLKQPYLHFQLDAFWNMVPSHIAANSNNFPNIKNVIMDTAISMLNNNMPFILDTVMPKGVDFIKNTLKNHDIIYIHITADLALTEKREIERGDRNIGLAKSQFDDIRRTDGYNLTIDTTNKKPDDVAKQIISKLKLK